MLGLNRDRVARRASTRHGERATIAVMLVLAAGVAGTTTWPRPAAAATRPASETVAELNRRATDEYERVNFDKAREILAAALAICESAGLTQDRGAAEAHLLMGVVLLAGGAAQGDDAAAEFRRAVEIRPSIVVPERLANPEVQRAFALATGRGSKVAPRTPLATTRQRKSRDLGESTSADLEGAPDATAGATADSSSDSDAGDTAEDASESVGSPRSWFIGFGAGSGLGWTSGNGEVTDAPVQSGFHPAAVAHLLPEIGYFIRPKLLISLLLRLQFVSGGSSERDPSMTMCGSDHVCSASKGATATFAKAAWFLGEGPTFRPYLAGMLGFGQIRHLASVPGVAACGTEVDHPTACTDTVGAGPVFLGPGGGLMVDVASHVALLFGVSTFFAVPKVTVHVDFDAGIAIAL